MLSAGEKVSVIFQGQSMAYLCNFGLVNASNHKVDIASVCSFSIVLYIWHFWWWFYESINKTQLNSAFYGGSANLLRYKDNILDAVQISLVYRYFQSSLSRCNLIKK